MHLDQALKLSIDPGPPQLARDETGVDRATVAGVLLCSPSSQDWLPQATIMATHYRGRDRASGQMDAQEIPGPLPARIADAVRFVVRNMRVAAQKTPARVDVPQYRSAAIFEAVVNAVAHRDYSMSSRRIRLSLFEDRLEVDSPGALPNGMTVERMEAGQATRNEVIASVFASISAASRSGEAVGSVADSEREADAADQRMLRFRAAQLPRQPSQFRCQPVALRRQPPHDFRRQFRVAAPLPPHFRSDTVLRSWAPAESPGTESR